MVRALLWMVLSWTGWVIAAESDECGVHHCLIVVDAGSTGSRMHLYTYDNDANGDPIQIHDLTSKKVHPGFASIESTPEAINHYLAALFQQLPEKRIPVYFYATAGMRLLSANKQKLYFDQVKQWAASQPLLDLKEARTITGTEEGLFGWLSVNYQLGALTSTNQPLVGVIDTGGASVQIAFPLVKISSDAIPSSDLVHVSIYRRNIDLFVHSFLGLGQNELDHQYLDEADCFSQHYPLQNGLLAQGNITSCAEKILVLVNDVHHVNGIVQPALHSNPVSNWYVIGGLSELVQDSPLSFEANQFTAKALSEQAGRELCGKEWLSLQEEYPNSDYLYANCINSAYFSKLLTDGYGIAPTTKIHYFSNKTKNNNWTLGVVLHH